MSGFSRFTELGACLRAYMRHGTTHGVRRAGWTRQGVAMFFWLLLFLLSLIAFCILLVGLVSSYKEYRVRSRVGFETHDRQPFPAVTICNLNPIDYYRLRNDEFVSIADVEKVSSVGSEDPSEVVRRAVTKALAKVGWRIGHPLNETVLYCAFNGKFCQPVKHFRITQNHRFGNCFTFNSGFDGEQVVESTITGPEHGLHVIVNTNAHKYVPGASTGEGIRIAVHPATTAPDLRTEAFSAPNGYEASVTVKPMEFKRLQGPHGSCVEESARLGYHQSVICRQTDYEIGYSMTRWPSENHRSTLMNLLSSGGHGWAKYSQELTSLKVYYTDFNKQTVQEEIQYTFVALLAHIGGLSALFIGVSLLTMFEYAEMFVSLAVLGTSRSGNDDGNKNLVEEEQPPETPRPEVDVDDDRPVGLPPSAASHRAPAIAVEDY